MNTSPTRSAHGFVPSFVPACLAAAFFCVLLAGWAQEPPSPKAILQDLRAFREMGRVLHVAAHPDDENTQLITALARGRGCAAAYLSITRGDGGQNVLGPEFDEQLGLIRTQELLAARRLDHGRQFFTRAVDFGFSKDYRETLTVWDHQQVLADVVRVIRTFRPDVVITRFSPEPSKTHGHHTASAVLALEAFKIAGDPKAFPEQLTDLQPWQPKRILVNRGGGRGGGGGNSDGITLEVGGDDPVTGESFGQIAGRSRAMHKTQGFGNFGGGGRGAARESFQLLAGAPAVHDIFEGVDTTWNRVAGGAEISKLADDAIAGFNLQDPAASIPALLKIRSLVTALPSDAIVKEKLGQLDRVIQSCLGLTFETVSQVAEVVPGETLTLRHKAMVQASVPVRWMATRHAGLAARAQAPVNLQPGQPATRETMEPVPNNTPVTQPYWLRRPRTAGMFQVEDPSLIGRPENPPAFPIEQIFEVGGQTISFQDEPVAITTDAARGEVRSRVDVIPPVTLRFSTKVALTAPGARHAVSVEVTADRAGAAGDLRLEMPAGWSVEPSAQPFQLKTPGSHARFDFTVTAPATPGNADVTTIAMVSGVRFSHERIEIRYPHIPRQLLQPAARVRMVGLDLAIRGKNSKWVTRCKNFPALT
jgi:LmbE family N-acetylglucosaminyl deacetylase